MRLEAQIKTLARSRPDREEACLLLALARCDALPQRASALVAPLPRSYCVLPSALVPQDDNG